MRLSLESNLESEGTYELSCLYDCNLGESSYDRQSY